jgi:hypothetical protein
MSLWTNGELEIVEVLTRRVRLICQDQLASFWQQTAHAGHPLHGALTRLLSGGLIHRTVVNAHPRLVIESPLAAWRPGRKAPGASRIASRIRNRWSQPAEPTAVYWASKKAASLFGSTASELSPLLHRDHDLLLAEVYVFYRRNYPQLSDRWLGEEVFPKAGYRVKDPDAFLFAEDGSPQLVIESAGRYSRGQIEAFHEHCVEYDLAYELW